MAGSDSRFDAGAFRRAIKNAMRMGAPEESERGVVFRWSAESEYSKADPASHPYSWAATPTAMTTHPDVQVDCAVEFSAGTADISQFGRFARGRVVITLLDDDYDDVRGADLAVIDGDTYEIVFEAPPQALFDVGVHTLYADARDESRSP